MAMTKRQRSEAAKKSWETRRANEEFERRSKIAMKAVATRKRNARIRSLRAKKAAATRAARAS